MVISTESALDLADVELGDLFVKEYDDAVVYGDMESETVLHEGAIRLLANGWVELPSGRLLSPTAVHHIDENPDADG
ncbi:hypothetical protein [Natrinema salifodinae]|uniref:Uncharacterized protein n=1 Tax=Natrinema salifodinae TaxID=1202768 RepID=A0A1I0Q593_9EURY|nr:hypothetical protein [Natrinema salifodinae]SEW21978.1 hypothetical protein SAMN05216285_3081 [Natrinema salifodinae]